MARRGSRSDAGTNVVPIVSESYSVDSDEVTGKVFVTIGGRDYIKNYDDFGLTFDSTESEIISAISDAVREELGQDITSLYKVRKAENTKNIYIIPNSVAG